MKTIGLIGGMSWESSLLYYKIINERTNAMLGKQNNAKSIMITLNFQEIEQFQHQGKWDEAAQILADASSALQKAGADFILICTNTMHKLLPKIQEQIDIPFLHIAKATADAIKAKGITKVGLLGTKFTMQEDFYKQILIDEGIEVIIPNQADIETIHKIIYNELCLGEVKDDSRNEYVSIVNKMPGIGGVILGCTEIGMLLSQEDFDSSIEVLDTTIIHATEAVRLCIS